jgi:hypothetical protein
VTLNIARIFMYGSQSISMAIVIYLFMKFAEPVGNLQDKAKRESIV